MTGWDRPDIEIEIVRHAPAATRIEEIAADIEEDGLAVRVSAIQRTGQRDPQLTADVTIKAPRATRFEEARIVSGRVTVSHFAGGREREVRQRRPHRIRPRGNHPAGNVARPTVALRGAFDPRRPDSSARVPGQRGSHTGLQPPDARILATTFNGRITSDIPLNAKDQFGVRFAETHLGRGEPVISIDVVTGNIEIRVRKGP